MCKCQGCEYYDIDYAWDGEDEWTIDICETGHDEYLDSEEECPYYKKYRQRKYVETDTECDLCEFLEQCNENGYVLNCTTRYDDRQHFIKGRGFNCRKLSCK